MESGGAPVPRGPPPAAAWRRRTLGGEPVPPALHPRLLGCGRGWTRRAPPPPSRAAPHPRRRLVPLLTLLHEWWKGGSRAGNGAPPCESLRTTPLSSSCDGLRTRAQRATADGGKEHMRGMAGISGLLSSLSRSPSLTHTMPIPSLLQLDFASSSPTLPLIVRRGVEKYGVEQEQKMRESCASSISGPLCVLAGTHSSCCLGLSFTVFDPQISLIFLFCKFF
jgi:hypothetical protein